jgi:tRNA pseudouridine32 synthase/23S rRNA pseudouridine746 synthase
LATNKICFTAFSTIIEEIILPEKFTFPFYYEPHPLAKIAANELQKHLKNQSDWKHNFGVSGEFDLEAIGKMFGVLVVKNSAGELGYLAAFSGKLANSNHHPLFVPPVFDILKKDGFYKIEEEEVNELNRRLEKAMTHPDLLKRRVELKEIVNESEGEISALKIKNSENKKLRKHKRIEAQTNLPEEGFLAMNRELDKQSSQEHFLMKDLTRKWKSEIDLAKNNLETLELIVSELKSKRGKRSAELQKKIFRAYSFLNKKGETKSLLEIFSFLDPLFPPAGAGECAAPKLLHYAYKNNFEPIALAEFWWGQTLSSEIRQHKNFYPACKGKCEPILGHMLLGLNVEENPLLSNPSYNKTIEIVYEDEHLLVVNKPNEFLSVPGVNLTDSVQTRMKEKYPNATGPLIVHRLDMSTSGLMIIALSKEVHKSLQSLFIKRSLIKQYVAILDGTIEGEGGFIDLPLRLDIDDRPRQMVCFEHGKSSRTQWKVIDRKDGKTKIQFFPITGRTHQLRVHSAHKDGLNTPILGDDLYGKRDSRLYLHAERLEFTHPVSSKFMIIESPAKF